MAEPDSKDTGEPWPEITMRRSRALDMAAEPIADAHCERYVPIHAIRERMLSDESIEGFRNGTGPMRRLTAENIRSGVSALLDAAFSKEEGSDG